MWAPLIGFWRKAQEFTAAKWADARTAAAPQIARLEDRTRDLLQRLSVPVRPRSALAGVGAFVLVLLAVAFFATRQRTAPIVQQPPVAVEVPVTVDVIPASALLSIDGKAVPNAVMPVSLPKGVHRFEAKKPGYRGTPSSVDVQSAQTITIELQPLPTLMNVAASEGVKIRVDGQDAPPTGELAPGDRMIEVAGQRGSASMALQVGPGRLPALTGVPALKGASILAASIFNGTVALRSSDATAKLMVDNQPAGQLTGGALDLSLEPGDHDIAIENQPASHLKVSIGEQPQIAAAVWWEQPKVPIEALLRRAQELYDAGQYEGCLGLVNEILRQNPKHEGALQLRAKAVKAIDTYRRLLGR